tara:strand:+ start:15 stop:269 length:255 start_codon:yes stop_codon:yes gene_type:complete
MLYNGVRAMVANFKGQNGGGQQSMTEVDMLTTLIMLLLVVFILAFFGKFLWNELLVKYVTFCKPIDSWVDLLGLVLLFNILFSR